MALKCKRDSCFILYNFTFLPHHFFEFFAEELVIWLHFLGLVTQFYQMLNVIILLTDAVQHLLRSENQSTFREMISEFTRKF